MDKISLDLLRKFHFSDNEARVYLALLELGVAAASEVSRLAKIPRPTAYVALESLLEDGYVTSLPQTKVKHYQASDPYALLVEMENSTRNFRQMLPYLRSKQKSSKKPNVSYYSGEKGAGVAFSQIKRPKEAYYATSISEIKKHLPEEYARWEELYSGKKVRSGSWHLLQKTEDDFRFGQILQESGQEVRYLDKNDFWDMDLVLFDGKVILATFEGGTNVTMIESEGLFNSLKQLYLLAWKSADKVFN